MADLIAFVPELARSRLRNLADYYSLFAAVSDLLQEGWQPTEDAARRLSGFVDRVEAARTRATAQADDPEAHAYLNAARAASNDAGPRLVRIKAMNDILST